jgi:hypothetical protein
MKKSTLNPLYELAKSAVEELDMSSIVMVEQATRMYKTLHSKTEWLERYHHTCAKESHKLSPGLRNEEFYDSILTALVWEALEKKLGAAKSSYQLYADQIEAMEKELQAGSYEKMFRIYPRKVWEQTKQRLVNLQYPWLSYDENLLLLMSVAFHAYYWETITEKETSTIKS